MLFLNGNIHFDSPSWLYLRNVITCRTRALQLRNWGCTYLKKQLSWTMKLKLRWNHISARTWRCKNYHHVNRLVLRIVLTVFFFFNSYALTFCTRSQITWRYFSQFSIIFIAQFCSCYTESHLSFICPSSWTTNQAKLWGYLWPIGLDTLLAYYTENFVFSVLYRGKTDN